MFARGRILCILFLAIASLSSGCAVFLVGAGAAGGYAIGKDEIEGFTDKKFDKAWDASRKVVGREGVILGENKTLGEIQAKVRETEVKAVLSRVSEKTVRIRIKARKGYRLLPDIATSQDLFTKILKELG